MKIKDILKLETNKAVNGTFTVKTDKKKWEDSEGWMNQVLLCDKTGEMLADIHIRVYQPIQRGQQINLIQAMTQPSPEGIRLYVEEFEYTNTSNEPPLWGEMKVIQGKIKTHLAGACLVNNTATRTLEFLKSKECEDIIRELMK